MHRCDEKLGLACENSQESGECVMGSGNVIGCVRKVGWVDPASLKDDPADAPPKPEPKKKSSGRAASAASVASAAAAALAACAAAVLF